VLAWSHAQSVLATRLEWVTTTHRRPHSSTSVDAYGGGSQSTLTGKFSRSLKRTARVNNGWRHYAEWMGNSKDEALGFTSRQRYCQFVEAAIEGTHPLS
jgi:hypothetical protein